MVILCGTIAVLGIIVFFTFTACSINKISQMTLNDMIISTTKNNKKAIIAIGVSKNKETNIAVYGKDGSIISGNEYIFEIGSITKTFTASLLLKAIIEGKIDLDANINIYLDLPQKEYYPTIRRLITHTSGYKSNYFEMEMISNFFRRSKNSFYNISKDKLIERIGKINLKDKDYEFKYSNFGIAVIGAILSEVYGNYYDVIINEFITEELHLKNTNVSDGSGNLSNYWEWALNDAYVAAGALTSTIVDMLEYSQLQMDEKQIYLSGTHEMLVKVNATSVNSEKLNIHIDGMGMAWILDNQNKIVWHNGGTSSFNSYIGFDSNNNIAVVILSNLPPNYRIPATVMGIKLLTDLQKEQ